MSRPRRSSRWSGRALDPAIAAIFADAPAELLADLDPDDLWAAVVDAEPAPRRTFRDEAALDEALAGFGDAADLKTPWFHGHSGGVARLARAAAARARRRSTPTLVYRAGLLHDLGRVAVPTGIWERPGPLRPEEWELVRLHPYHSGRILARSPVLAPLGPDREPPPRARRTAPATRPACARPSSTPAACLLAAADVLHALGEPRPHRPALDPPAASRVLSGLPLDRDAIRAVLDAAGAPPPALPPLPADLTERELDVLRRLVAGRTKREIAAELVISQSTVHTHTVHIYAQVRRLDAGRPRDVRDAARARGQDRPAPRTRRSTERSIVRPARPSYGWRRDAPDRRSHHDHRAPPQPPTSPSSAQASRPSRSGDLAGVRRHVPRRRDLEPPQRRPPRRDPPAAATGSSPSSASRPSSPPARSAPCRRRCMADGEGHVAVLVRVSATRPDGRSFDDPQILLFKLEGDRVQSVDQFVGDPAAVNAFWASGRAPAPLPGEEIPDAGRARSRVSPPGGA